MRKIQVLLYESSYGHRLVQLACYMTRGANKYANVSEAINDCYRNPWNKQKCIEILSLPHSKLSRIIDFTFIITGASRRFLAQLTTHHIGITHISGSLQYSDHSKRHLDDMFVVPYNLLDNEDEKREYLISQQMTMEYYNAMVKAGLSNDDAGYTAPQSLRNCVLVKVNLEELRYMANQRLCKRNTQETSYIIARMVECVVKTYDFPSEWFMPSCCKYGACAEGKYSCGKPIAKGTTIFDYLIDAFPLLK